MRIKLGIPLTLEEVSTATDGSVTGSHNQSITHLVTDSREVVAGDLFFALTGKKKSGEDYKAEVKAAGGIVVSAAENDSDITVDNVSTALLNLASSYLKKLPLLLYRIAITGSVGKTTVKEFSKLLLQKKYKVHATMENYNNEIGVPLSILTAPPDTEVMIIEMGMNHPGEISILSKCLAPDIAIITNIGTAHIGNLKSRENIAKAKLEIVDGMREKHNIMVPFDEKLLSDIQGKITVSTTKNYADFAIIRKESNRFALFQNSVELTEFTFKLKEAHNVSCLVFSVALGLLLGLSTDQIQSAISSITRYNTRQNVVKRKNIYFLTDYYNASFESDIACINTLLGLTEYSRKSLLLGDILELGEASDAIHVKLGSCIPSDEISNLYLFGAIAEKIAIGAIKNGFPPNRIFLNSNTERPDITADQIKKNSVDKEIIGMKASRGIRLERVLSYFN
ncbi:MAG: UDP-N-acetylmuramoyl-tripeptide--D-alanyl-D-alanine ligase [Clostridia bacterium]|nr:UDP-N-acetylmuramoyl-tripeptide--D-alanyl-D-alanine ligase [Clostridia bacterium]